VPSKSSPPHAHLCDRGSERRLAVIDMTDRADVQVRLRPRVDVVCIPSRRKASAGGKAGQVLQRKRMLQRPAVSERQRSDEACNCFLKTDMVQQERHRLAVRVGDASHDAEACTR